MRNYQLIQGFGFGTLLIVVAVGCGSSANDGGGGAGGVSAASGGESAASSSGADIGGGASTAGGNGTTSPAVGGSSAGGVASTAGGSSSTGGSAPAAATGVLGQQCSPPGTLGCNGINQKLTLVCGANGTWQTNQTCNSATQVCDPRPGSTQGTCQEQDAACATGTPGQQLCSNNAEWKCDAWGMKASKVQDCTSGACAEGKCFDS